MPAYGDASMAEVGDDDVRTPTGCCIPKCIYLYTRLQLGTACACAVRAFKARKRWPMPGALRCRWQSLTAVCVG